MSKSFSRLALGLLAATLGSAAIAAPATYTVDDSHSFARFGYNHLGLTNQQSTFGNAAGTIVLDTEAKTGEVKFTVDTRTVNTGNETFNQHIQAADFLNTAEFPEATFVSRNVVFEGDKPSKIEGDLTIKGVTKPVTFDITSFSLIEHPMAKRPVIGAEAQAQIKRSDFGAGKFAPATSDEVTLTVVVEALQS